MTTGGTGLASTSPASSPTRWGATDVHVHSRGGVGLHAPSPAGGYRTCRSGCPSRCTALRCPCAGSPRHARRYRRSHCQARVTLGSCSRAAPQCAAPGHVPVEDMEDPVAEKYNGYCVKCKDKRDFDGEVKVSESGRRMAQGLCPVCGTKMNRILGKA